MQFEIIFTMKNGENICVTVDGEMLNALHEVMKDLQCIGSDNVTLNFNGKLVNLKKVEYFRWYVKC